VFAARPAPVQVTWLGYPNTTGLSVMDYRLTDEWADPEGITEHHHTESLVRLPNGFLCYRPPMMAPEPADCPSLETGHVTFGSFNSFVKMTPEVFRTWANILHAVPGSRLLLKNFSLNDPDIRAQCQDTFQSLDVGSECLELHAILPSRQAHLELYRRIDIALDTFPYNGTTTTCEALWMGIPVVTLAGDHHAGRVGVSLMNALGLPQLIATHQDEYCRLAVALAPDIDQRQQWRISLRKRMEASSLCDGAGFACNVELAYRQIWKKWCAATPGN
jgi:protein O-GlcNAc transferase